MVTGDAPAGVAAAEPVRLDIDGQVATIWIQNPPMNLLTQDVRRGVLAALDRLRAMPDVRAVILTGAGDRAFCAGADLREEARLDEVTVKAFRAEIGAMYDALWSFDRPVIAAIHGAAMGGGFELILACTIRIGADNVQLAATGVKIGLVVSTTRLTRLLGEARALDLILTGRVVEGEEALRMGLVSKIVPRSELMAEARRWAQLIASRAPIAVRNAKRSILSVFDHDHATSAALQAELWQEAWRTEDHKEAVRSFLEKRAPEFRGR